MDGWVDQYALCLVMLNIFDNCVRDQKLSRSWWRYGDINYQMALERHVRK